MCKGNGYAGLTSGCTYNQMVNSSKGVMIKVKVGLHLGLPTINGKL